MTPELEHWTANTGHCRVSRRSEVGDAVAELLATLIAAAGTYGIPAPLTSRDSLWRLHVLAHDHGPRVLQARILAPDGQPVVLLAAGEDANPGAVRAWRVTVASVPWFIDGADPSGFLDPPDAPWLIASLLPALAVHPNAAHWLGDAERCIAWAWLDSLPRIAEA